MDVNLARQHIPRPELYNYTTRDLIIYALGVGARTHDDMRYVYENDENFSALPTFVVAPGLLANGISDWPGVKFDLQRVLHGEQYIEVYKPLPTDGAQLRSETRVVDILDKGSGALILSNITTFDAKTGEKLAMQQFATFEVGMGNFGGSRTSTAEKEVVPVPKRTPDAVVEQQTSVDQATLYRLGSGDSNPLHIDPTFAKISGFKQPILHGLCSLGFAVRHVLKRYAGNDANLFRAVKVRFSKPVIPGQTLCTEMWRVGNRIHFQTKAKETGEIVLASAYVDLTDVKDSNTTCPANAAPKQSTTSSTTKSSVIFDEIGKELKNQPDAVKRVNAIIVYVIKQNGKEVATYTIDLKNGNGAVYEGMPKSGEKANATVTVEDDDFVQLAEGKLDPTKAFMSGKLKVSGNIMLLQKLQGLMEQKKKSNI